MKLWEKITVVIIVFMVVGGALYDVIALANGGVESTISRVVLDGACKHPIIAFAMGVLCGHLFWPQRPAYEDGLREGLDQWKKACAADFEQEEDDATSESDSTD